jgi:hypothetical protein
MWLEAHLDTGTIAQTSKSIVPVKIVASRDDLHEKIGARRLRRFDARSSTGCEKRRGLGEI